MKKLLAPPLLLLFSCLAWAAGKSVPVELAGWVTNRACDPRAMKADAEACMRKCKEQGQVQFVDDAQHKVWDVSNAKDLAGLESQHVKLRATLDEAHKNLSVLSVKKSPAPSSAQ